MRVFPLFFLLPFLCWAQLGKFDWPDQCLDSVLPQNGQTIKIEHHDWDSHNAIRWVLAILLQEGLGYQVTFVDSSDEPTFQTFENVGTGRVDVNPEVWMTHKAEQKKEWVDNMRLVFPGGSLGTRGTEGLWLPSRAINAHPRTILEFFKSYRKPEVVSKVVNASVFPQAPVACTSDDGETEHYFECPSGSTAVTGNNKYACNTDDFPVWECQEGVWFSDSCCDSTSSQCSTHPNISNCAAILYPTPDWTTGILEQTTQNLNMPVSFVYSGSPASHKRTVTDTLSNEGDVLFYWFTPDSFLSSLQDGVTSLSFPPWVPDCDFDQVNNPNGTKDCGIASSPLQKIVTAGLASRTPNAHHLINELKFAQTDYDYIFELTNGGSSTQQAACSWIRNSLNAETFDQWVKPSKDDTLSLDDKYATLFFGLGIAVVAVLLVILLLLASNSNKRPVSQLGLGFIATQICGHVILVVGAILYFVLPSNAICAARISLLTLGQFWVLSSVLTRLWWLDHTLRLRVAAPPKDKVRLWNHILLVNIALTVFLLIIHGTADPPVAQSRIQTDWQIIRVQCEQSSLSQLIGWLLFGLMFCFGSLALFTSVRIYDRWSLFNEPRNTSVAAVVFVLALVLVLTFVHIDESDFRPYVIGVVSPLTSLLMVITLLGSRISRVVTILCGGKDDDPVGRLSVMDVDYLIAALEDSSLCIDDAFAMLESFLRAILQMSDSSRAVLLVHKKLFPFVIDDDVGDSDDDSPRQYPILDEYLTMCSLQGDEFQPLCRRDSIPVNAYDYGNFSMRAVVEAILSGEIEVVNHAARYDSLGCGHAGENNVKSMVAVPIKIRGQVQSVVYLECLKGENAFAGAVTVLRVFASTLSTALHSTWLYHKQERTAFLLQVAQKARSSFLGNMSHELRTPLNGVMATVEELMQEMSNTGSLGQDCLTDLLDIGCSSDGLLRLSAGVSNFLTLSSSVLKPNRHQRVALRPFLSHVVGGIDMWCDTGMASACLFVDSQVPHVVCEDASLLGLVVQHLVENAFKVSAPEKEVVCRVAMGQQPVEMAARVATPGTGSNLARIRFEIEDWGEEPFPQDIDILTVREPGQADASAQRKLQGLGMGLSTVAMILQLFIHPDAGVVRKSEGGSIVWFEVDMFTGKNKRGRTGSRTRHKGVTPSPAVARASRQNFSASPVIRHAYLDPGTSNSDNAFSDLEMEEIETPVFETRKTLTKLSVGYTDLLKSLVSSMATAQGVGKSAGQVASGIEKASRGDFRAVFQEKRWRKPAGQYVMAWLCGVPYIQKGLLRSQLEEKGIEVRTAMSFKAMEAEMMSQRSQGAVVLGIVGELGNPSIVQATVQTRSGASMPQGRGGNSVVLDVEVDSGGRDELGEMLSRLAGIGDPGVGLVRLVRRHSPAFLKMIGLAEKALSFSAEEQWMCLVDPSLTEGVVMVPQICASLLVNSFLSLVFLGDLTATPTSIRHDINSSQSPRSSTATNNPESPRIGIPTSNNNNSTQQRSTRRSGLARKLSLRKKTSADTPPPSHDCQTENTFSEFDPYSPPMPATMPVREPTEAFLLNTPSERTQPTEAESRDFEPIDLAVMALAQWCPEPERVICHAELEAEHLPLSTRKSTIDSKPVQEEEEIVITRVLIVEDSVINSRLLTKLVQRLVPAVAHALNGEIGVNAFREAVEEGNPFDLVLMDCQMPVMDGLEATRKIREFEVERGLGRCFIAAVTAGASDSSPTECHAAGMDVYVQKPVKRNMLTELWDALEGSKTSSRIRVIGA